MAPISRNTSNASNIDQSTLNLPTPMGAPGGPIEIAFTFDTTGSMYGCLTEVRQKIREIIERLFADIPNLRIAVFAHGDYCDSSKYVTKYVDFTNDVKKLCDFVQKVKSTSGGDWEECYELVLKQSRELLSWTPGTQRALVMIGDAIPHPPTDPQNKDNIDWKIETQRLRDEMGVRIYSVQAYGSVAAKDFWESLAKMTYGKHLNLGQFDTIVDMMMAICYREHGAEFFEAYEREVRAREGTGIRKELDRMFDTLRDGETPVAAGGPDAVSAPSLPFPAIVSTSAGKGGAASIAKAAGRIAKPRGIRKSKSIVTTGRILKRAVKGSASMDTDTVKYTIGKQYRETVPASNNEFETLKWTRWQPAMAPTVPATGTSVWKPRRNGEFGVRNTSLFNETFDGRAVYEMAVQVHKRMYPVYLRSTACTRHVGYWDRHLLRSSDLNRKVSSVLQKGCKLFIRQAKLDTPVNFNGEVVSAVHTLRKLMRDTYDYAWVKTSSKKNCRCLERKGVTISE